MKFLSPKNRIALGMTGAVVAVICLARMAGYIPDRCAFLNSSRAELAETVAIGSSLMIMTQDTDGLESFLQGVGSRNQDVESFGVRTVGGDLVVEFGAHDQNWEITDGQFSSSNQIQVPIFESRELKWGTCLLYTSPSPRDATLSRMPSSA